MISIKPELKKYSYNPLFKNMLSILETHSKTETAIYISDVNYTPEEKTNQQKILVFCDETMYNKAKLYNKIVFFIKNFIKNLIIKKKHNIFYTKNIWVIFFNLYYIIYKRPYFVHLLKSLNTSKNKFAIATDGIKSKNILNFPYFFHHYFGRFKDFITAKKNIHTKKKFCAFIVSNGENMERKNFFKKLSKYKKVDSYGSIFNNAKFPDDLVKKHRYKNNNVDKIDTSGLNQELFRTYKFVICFENTYTNDYITEKLPNVMMGNSIGIYRGAPNIGTFFNTDSFINWDDYGSDKAVIKKIIALDNDDKAYQKMLQQPFFKDNKIPNRCKTAEEDLKDFLINKVIG